MDIAINRDADVVVQAGVILEGITVTIIRDIYAIQTIRGTIIVGECVPLGIPI